MIRVVIESSIVIVAVETVQFKIEVGDVHVLPAVAVDIGGIDAHARFIAAVLAGGHSGDERDVLKRAVMPVEEEEIGPGIVGDGDIGPSIVVKIRKNHAHAFRFRFADSRRVTDVGKRAVMIVVVELGFLPFVIPWMAVRAITHAMFAAPNIIFRRPFDVVGDEQIQPAVFVVVKPSGAGGPTAQVGNGGFFGDVSKGAVAIVVVKDGAAVTRDVNVWEAVVVVVADGNTLAVIEPCHASAHGLQIIFFFGLRSVLKEGDSRFFANIGVVNRNGGLLRSWSLVCE